jgi:hypothetical protein
MAPRKNRASRPCKPAEIKIRGKCYRLFLVAAQGGIVKGADCGNIMVDVSGELGEKPGKSTGSKKKK